MIYNVFGTHFWKVVMLTWCNGIPSFSKVKNSVSETLSNKGSGAPFSAKSAKKGAPDPLFYHADRIVVSGSVILTWCHGISPIFNFRKRVIFSLRFESLRDFFGQNPRGPSHLFDFSAPGRPRAGQSLLPPIP